MPIQRRIPFDSLVLAAVVRELQPLAGSRVQKVLQPDETTVLLGVYGPAGEVWLLISCDPVFFRAHLISRRPKGVGEPLGFCQALRARLSGAQLASVAQVGFDRILRIEFDGEHGGHTLITELMGKHSNLILVGPEHKVVSAAKWVRRSKSSRPITPGTLYSPPPFPARLPLWDARKEGDLKVSEGASPFLIELLAARAGNEGWPEVLCELVRLRETVQEGAFAPVIVEGFGGYPVSVAAMGYVEVPAKSISEALESHYERAVATTALDQGRKSLLGQLERVLLARQSAKGGLEVAADTAARAGELQQLGELILAFGPSSPPGSSTIEAIGYDGNPVSIPVAPEKTYVESARRYFDRAKKAKAGAGEVRARLQQIAGDIEELEFALDRVRAAETPEAIEEILAQARRRKWRQAQRTSAKPEDRPYAGHRIRELSGPGGVTILYGENATSNDYLTSKVSKPNDWWLHVRGSPSAHVVIPTANKPERVQMEALLFAAKIAVKNSPSKHSGFVPVDYTLRKHVRKPRGSAPGVVTYSNEKTLHVEDAD